MAGPDGEVRLPLPITARFDNLPPEGCLVSPDQELCDPIEVRCQEIVYVWESKCNHCHGTGQVVSGYGSRGSRGMFTCTVCQGLGYIRHTSTEEPDPAKAEEALERTINRPSPQMDSDRLARLREKAERGRRLLRQLEDRARELEEAKERRARQERERLRNGGPSPCAEGTGAPSGSAGSGAGHAFPDAHPAQRLADF